MLKHEDIVERFEELVRVSRLTLAGFKGVIDVVTELDDALITRIVNYDGSEQCRAFAAFLVEHAQRGSGGERRLHWAEGAAVLAKVVRGRRAAGGTSVQAAQTLAAVGAPVLLSVGDRSAEFLDLLAPEVSIAEKGALVSAREAGRRPLAPQIPVYVFEFQAGSSVGGKMVPRSSRLIIRLEKTFIDDDPDFEARSTHLAASAGGAIVGGLNASDPGELPAALAYVHALVARWRAAGLNVVHLELASFPAPSGPIETCAALGPVVTSVGMSASELHAMSEPSQPTEEAAALLAERFDIPTVVVHGDRKAMAVTRQDPDRVGEGLLMGNLCAATRAAHGRPARPRLGPLPWLPDEGHSFPAPVGARTIVSRPAAYLRQPRATVGLGDTFAAGLVLALGAQGNSRASQACEATTDGHPLPRRSG